MNEQANHGPSPLLIQRYRIIGLVGKGGFGAVYKAEDVQRNNSLVAIKSINLSGLSSRERIEATDTFNREARLLSGLEHPNLPRLYDHFTDPQHWYLAMNFIEGETLEDHLAKAGGKLPVQQVLDIGMQLCTVLHYLHTHQPPIIFRDIKPANVMRTATRHLYLIDFGIARHFTPGQSRDTDALGSPGYAAPEQYGKAQTTVQSDIYSLGATLQTLLTGKEPLELASGDGSLYPQGQGVPAALERLLERMLDLDASKRPANIETVKQTLQRIKEEPSSCRTETREETLVAVSLLLSISVLLLLLLAGSGFGVWCGAPMPLGLTLATYVAPILILTSMIVISFVKSPLKGYRGSILGMNIILAVLLLPVLLYANLAYGFACG